MRPRIKTRNQYNINSVAEAKNVANIWLKRIGLVQVVDFGLPEIDDRYNIWRVPLINKVNSHHIGEAAIDAISTFLDENKTTKPDILKSRILNGNGHSKLKKQSNGDKYEISAQRNTIALGDAETVLQEMAAKSVDLIFTSPPYYNARPEYSDYLGYEDYLLKMRKIIQQCHRVLNEGRFFVMNVAPVLIRRASRSDASKRIAVPFDIHRIFTEEGFDFMEDIIWVKPEGAGWATGRGRRFAADRTPLQYKAVPVTEYILVYRKHTDKLIDWNIRTFPDQSIVKKSKIPDGYDKTNVWNITPSHTKKHPATFPVGLAEKIIKYYSFKNDVVLDPFAGIGTVGQAAINLSRRFVLIELEKKYLELIKSEIVSRLGKSADDVLYINCAPPKSIQRTLL